MYLLTRLQGPSRKKFQVPGRWFIPCHQATRPTAPCYTAPAYHHQAPAKIRTATSIPIPVFFIKKQLAHGRRYFQWQAARLVRPEPTAQTGPTARTGTAFYTVQITRRTEPAITATFTSIQPRITPSAPKLPAHGRPVRRFWAL